MLEERGKRRIDLRKKRIEYLRDTSGIGYVTLSHILSTLEGNNPKFDEVVEQHSSPDCIYASS